MGAGVVNPLCSRVEQSLSEVRVEGVQVDLRGSADLRQGQAEDVVVGGGGVGVGEAAAETLVEVRPSCALTAEQRGSQSAGAVSEVVWREAGVADWCVSLQDALLTVGQRQTVGNGLADSIGEEVVVLAACAGGSRADSAEIGAGGAVTAETDLDLVARLAGQAVRG